MPRKEKNKKATRKTKKKMKGGTLTEEQKSMATLYRIRKPEIEREMEKYSFLEFLMDKDPHMTLIRKREYNRLITDRVISNKEIPEHDKPRIERTIKHIIDPNIGKKEGKAWLPLITTFFLFIVSANLLGMIPIFEFI